MSELTVEGVFTTLAVTAVRAKAIRAAGKKSSDRRCEVPARPLQWGGGLRVRSARSEIGHAGLDPGHLR